MDGYENAKKEYDLDRREAFKRIAEEFHSPRRRRKEKLKWYQQNPSPRSPEEKARNLLAALQEA